MRLKFLFFPITLAISLMIIIGYIWPDIGSIIKINNDKAAKNTELLAIKSKQRAIESIGKEMTDDATGKTLVNSYLPENKTEDRIISGINYLAGDANVLLVNITLSTPKAPVVVAPAADPAFVAPVIDPVTGLPTMVNSNPLGKTTAKISLAGEYSKIKIFLDSLQRMPIINTVKSVHISKQKSVTTDPAAAATPSSVLSVDVDVDFGFVGVSKVDNAKAENFVATIDKDTITSLGQYISQKSQLVDNNSGVKGKTNPFLAN